MWGERNGVRLCAAAICVILAACSDSTGTEAGVQTPESTGSETSAAPAPTEDGTIDPMVMAKWARNCALCHVRGEGGAPRLGDPNAWGDRLARGEESMLTHTIEGLNNMPPLGYCMECERDDLITLIRFMAKSA